MSRAFYLPCKCLVLCAILLTGPRAPGQGHCPAGVVFIADDAGAGEDFRIALAQTIREDRLPLQVVPVVWSNAVYASDNKNHELQRAYGQKVANQIMNWRRTCPGTRVYLVGFGVGSAVVVHAAECLPYNTVTRIILVASALSAKYDLKPALFASCEGIHSISSNYDTVLAYNIKWFHSADGVKRSAGGLSGFEPQVECHQDAFLYSKLRQDRLEPLDPTTNAGHIGYYQPRFLKGHVIPVFRVSLGLPLHAAPRRLE